MLTNEILDEIYQDREAHAELFNFKIDSNEKKLGYEQCHIVILKI